MFNQNQWGQTRLILFLTDGTAQSSLAGKSIDSDPIDLYLHRARSLGDLRVPPGNRLEALRGDRKGQYSIRINDQWRICFRWSQGGAYEVEIVDYH